MGLTIHYEWKQEIDAVQACEKLVQFHAKAQQLPFDDVSEIFERNPPGGEFQFTPIEADIYDGSLYPTRKRQDGEDELVHVPSLHSIFFCAHIAGAESAAIGFASHPPVVVHREDIIERDDDGRDCGRIIGQGDPIEFPTGCRGHYSWQPFCKTQYAGNPKLGGAANFLKAHLTLVELLDEIAESGIKVEVVDDSEYAKHRDVDRLLKTIGEWDGMMANFAGALGDVLKKESISFVAPIMDRPDFEHLEAKGIDVLKQMAARQHRRKQS